MRRVDNTLAARSRFLRERARATLLLPGVVLQEKKVIRAHGASFIIRDAVSSNN